MCQEDEPYVRSTELGCLTSFLPQVRTRSGDEGETESRSEAKELQLWADSLRRCWTRPDQYLRTSKVWSNAKDHQPELSKIWTEQDLANIYEQAEFGPTLRTISITSETADGWPHLQRFWVTRSGMYRECTYQISTQVRLLLLVWGPHVENLSAKATLFSLLAISTTRRAFQYPDT